MSLVPYDIKKNISGLTPIKIKDTNTQIKKHYSHEFPKQINIYKDTYRLYNCFFLSKFDDYLIFFFNRNRAGIPLEGWFQECFGCSSCTGQLMYYGEVNNKPLYIRMCNKCGIIYNKYPLRKCHIEMTHEIKRGIKKIIY